MLRLKRSSADELKAALEKQKAELANSAANQLSQIEEQEKQKRIALVCERAARRIANAGLTRGWTAWVDAYYEQTRQMQLLKSAGARLSKPLLTATFVHWREDGRRRSSSRSRTSGQVR